MHEALVQLFRLMVCGSYVADGLQPSQREAEQ